MSNSFRGEGLKTARLLMVLSSISPLFVLWAIRGNKLLADRYFLPICAVMVVLPNLFLWMRIQTAKKLKEKKELVVGSAEDHRGDILVYLFAMLLPLYPIDLGTFRDLAALLAALAFVVFLFWHLSLHYMNLLFALFGYRVFTITAPEDNNPLSGRRTRVLLTHRAVLERGEHIVAFRLSDTVYFEAKE